MTQEYPWYDIVEGSEELEQGDFIDDCEILIPNYTLIEPTETGALFSSTQFKITGASDTYDVVIVSQSCDLENEKIDNVLICPHWSYLEFAEIDEKFKKPDKLELIRQGKEYRFCMLNKCDLGDLAHEIQIVDLSRVFSVPRDTMKQMAKSRGKRLRLLSPYKEMLAQSFAYFYMRVALPDSILKFEKAPKQVGPKLAH